MVEQPSWLLYIRYLKIVFAQRASPAVTEPNSSRLSLVCLEVRISLPQSG